MLRFACSWVTGGVAANAFQPQASSADPEREQEVYAVYSLMLTNPIISHGVDNNERLLIAMNTKPPVCSYHACDRPRQGSRVPPTSVLGALVDLDIVCRQWLLTPNITMVSNPVHACRSQ
jgi:hypothetical protein